MQLLLKSTIESLGRVGDVVDVSAGYARNFLLPRGHAVTVTAANKSEIDRARAQALAEETERVVALKDSAAKLSEMSITIEGRANDEGHLFGSVGAQQVADALKEKGYAVDVKNVRLDAPLKEIGVFDVAVHLHAEVSATVKVWVVQAKPS